VVKNTVIAVCVKSVDQDLLGDEGVVQIWYACSFLKTRLAWRSLCVCVCVFVRACHSLRLHPNNHRISFVKLCVKVMALDKTAKHLVLISDDGR